MIGRKSAKSRLNAEAACENGHLIARDLLERIGELLIGMPAPYGYDRVYFNAAGKEMCRIRRREKFRKPRDWTAKLAPSVDAQEVKTARWLFKTFVETDRSARSLAELNHLEQHLTSDCAALAKAAFSRVFKSVTLFWKPINNRYRALERAEIETHFPFCVTGSTSSHSTNLRGRMCVVAGTEYRLSLCNLSRIFLCQICGVSGE